MSSPFSAFRKYQKSVLAVVCVICVIVFTVELGLNRGNDSGGGGGSGKETVVSWKGGSLSAAEIHRFGMNTRQTQFFLDSVVREVALKGGRPKSPLYFAMMRGRRPAPQGGFEPAIPSAEQDILHTYLLAEKGKEMGITFGDEAALAFIAKVSDDTLKTKNQVDAEVRRLQRPEFTPADLLYTLRIHMAAAQVLLVTAPVLQDSSPAASWDYYKRFNRNLKAELLPLPVNDFLDRVSGAPSEAELKALFEEGKERYPHPDDPRPGFRRYEQATVEYVKFDTETYFAEEMKRITPQEVQEFYDKNKEGFRKPELPAQPPSATPDDLNFNPPGEAGPSGDQKKPVAEEKPDDKPATEEKPDDKPAAKADDKPAKEEEKPAPPADEKPAPAAEEKAEPKAEEKAEPQSAKRAASAEVVFVSALADKEADEPASKTDEPAPKADEPAPQPPAEKEGDPAAKAEPSTTPPEAPADAPTQEAKPEAPQPDVTKSEAPATGEAKPPETPAAPKPPEYRPLSEVEDEIRRSLARPAVKKIVDAHLAEVRSVLTTHFEEYNTWSNSQKKDPALAAPKFPDLAPLLAKAKSAHQKMGSLNVLELLKKESGSLMAREVFGASHPLYQPRQIGDSSFDQNLYVLWVTARKEAYTPEFADAQEEVEASWRRQAAHGLAKEAAEKIATAARAKGTPLKESLDKEMAAKVFDTNEFRWLFGFQNQFIPNRVDNVEGAGNEFHRGLSGLKYGEVGVTQNDSHTVVYVARISSDTPSEETLRGMFALAGTTDTMNALGSAEANQLFTKWVDQLESEMAVKWQRDPRNDVSDL